MKKKIYLKTSFLLLTLVIFSACLTNVEEEGIIEEPISEEIVISFAKDVKPIIDVNCASCHGPNSPNLTTLANIQANATTVKDQVETRRMPIGSSLTNAQIAIIVDWVDAGALDN